MVLLSRSLSSGLLPPQQQSSAAYTGDAAGVLEQLNKQAVSRSSQNTHHTGFPHSKACYKPEGRAAEDQKGRQQQLEVAGLVITQGRSRQKRSSRISVRNGKNCKKTLPKVPLACQAWNPEQSPVRDTAATPKRPG
jgi:hypothetical protein